MDQRRKNQGLLFLSLLLAGLLNYPLLKIFNKPVMLGGVPLLYAYVFCVWVLFIGVIWAFIRRSERS